LKAERMASNIRRLAYILKKNQLIPSNSSMIMEEAASNVKSGTPDKWELAVPPQTPLEFSQAEKDKRLVPDIFCQIKISNQGRCPISHLNVVVRVWSIKDDYSFRPDWDSESVRQILGRKGLHKRVMFRCHYDRCSESQKAPIFHLQFSGKPQNDELYWFPHTLELPRFPSPPMDLVLACELIVATFFPSVHERLGQNGTWISLIKESESFFTSTFYKLCKEYFDAARPYQTLLEHLCFPTY
jgi:hypothetical protein